MPQAWRARSRHSAEAFWPTADEQLLLRAALDNGKEAAHAWAAWRRTTSLDDASRECHDILPLAYRNLSLEADPDFERIRGAYRMSWSRNQLLFRSAAATLTALQDAGIQTLVLKGAALVALHYKDVGVRPMSDVDILVPLGKAPDAMSILQGLGLSPNHERPEDQIGVHHSELFAAGACNQIDLHWFSLWQSARDDDFWTGAVELKVGGVGTLGLCPADQLLHVSAHGTGIDPSPRVRWLADAMTVIASSGSEFDWDRFVSVAETMRLAPVAADALNCLKDCVGAAIPEGLIERLRQTPTTRWERRARRAALGPASPMRTLRLVRERHLRLKLLDPGRGQTSEGFLPYARRTWKAQGNWQLLNYAFRRGLTYTRARLSRSFRAVSD
jgi:putative nucleotidyltransferase-like protein